MSRVKTAAVYQAGSHHAESRMRLASVKPTEFRDGRSGLLSCRDILQGLSRVVIAFPVSGAWPIDRLKM